MTISNPILPGFHPDPAILRVEDDFYIATSTFEWHPGVQLHHSRDLVHWRPLGGILTTEDHLDLRGVPDSGGVWAPDLTYAQGIFHLVFGVVDNYGFGQKDVTVHYTSAPAIDGPWDKPVALPSRGFDPSLFHDHDGSTWLVNMAVDRTIGTRGFAGIQIQRIDRGLPLDDPIQILGLTEHGMTEGPHIYRIGSWYYLVVAEGGTHWEHGALVLRSRKLTGPYEADPNGPLITSRNDPSLPLQKAGHASLVSTLRGEWYAACLVGRPLTERGRCVLGRETALQKVSWVDEWPRIEGGVPALEVPAPPLPSQPWPPAEQPWSGLRRPIGDDWVRWYGSQIRIKGGQSPYGRRAPSLVGRPLTSLDTTFEAAVEFSTSSPHQSAGITAYYNARNWYYWAITASGLTLTGSDRGRRTVPASIDGDIEQAHLRIIVDGPELRFAYDLGAGWQELAATADATILSDEYAVEMIDGVPWTFGFTGTFLGLWVQDLANEGGYASFVVA